jgi:3-phenylpropionate/trans-cinnamate dioxygenase ferredoxin reductase subunit
MTGRQTFVIVGASLAGAKAVETLRNEGFDGSLVLIGAETERPYERPPLSKDYLRGESAREKVYVHDEAFYAENEIELLLGRTAVSLDTSIGQVGLDDGGRLRYDRLLLTTGAEVAASARQRGLDVTIQQLIRERASIDDRRLADPDVPLEDLVAVAGAGAP